ARIAQARSSGGAGLDQDGDCQAGGPDEEQVLGPRRRPQQGGARVQQRDGWWGRGCARVNGLSSSYRSEYVDGNLKATDRFGRSTLSRNRSFCAQGGERDTHVPEKYLGQPSVGKQLLPVVLPRVGVNPRNAAATDVSSV
ncbi:unnamed protein product, partial [Ectocarpus sp. 8 AP-2014]